MTDDQTSRVETTDGVDATHSEGAASASTPRRSPTRRLIVVGLAGGLALVAFVLWWFQPQALFIDDVVDEQFPLGTDVAAASADTDPDGTDSGTTPDPDTDPDGTDSGTAPDRNTDPDGTDETAPGPDTDTATDETATDETVAAPGPVAARSGAFSSRNRYEVTGTATAYTIDDTERILRLEDFTSTNGPDLYVYLTAADAAATDPELDADVVDLGVLTGNIGNQNYVIPPGVDLDVYDTVVIWCRRFATSFGVADLVAPTN